ncbi:hypothetical protein, conserved [Eimeria necatrix]|uniref:Uncharacterized protein n=1 Tax=Eimeria necatrix TaxID=51315 RepID=U6MQQ1_9EIME|nr:hypothetical protein, conserved [Eimeria necatrix]CDJ64799.1 hypothetical protein, conserved [Eimeria necatrix]
METILSGIADAPISDAAKRKAYELVLKIVNNIVKAAQEEDPNLPKFKWVKANSGSALREKVLNVSPLFLELLKALGFRQRVGRPPHVQNGAPQEYIVLEDNVSIDDLASNAQLIEAVLSSIPEGQSSDLRPASSLTSPGSAGRQSAGNLTDGQGTGQPPAHPLVSRSSASTAARRQDPEAELEAIRREQQERYRQRGAGGSSAAARPSAAGNENGSGQNQSGGGWFWQKFGWGGGSDSNSGPDNNNNNNRGRSTSSRRQPPSNRMMTLRDLPQPQRRG